MSSPEDQTMRAETEQQETMADEAGRVPLAEVLNIMWKSEGKPEDCAWTWVSLSRPADAEECPITQEPMQASALEFLPGVAFRKENPDYCRMKLECGHAFSAMAITYHFFKNGMMCPLCRKGHAKTLSALCVPAHFRRNMQEHLVIERAKERIEADRENMASVLLAAQESYATDLGFIVRRNRLSQHMLFLEAGAPRPAGFLAYIVDENTLVTSMLSGAREEDRLRVFLNSHRMCMLVYAYEPGDDLAPAAAMELPTEVWTLPPYATGAASDTHRIPYELSTRIQRGEGTGPDPAKSVLVISMPRSSLREMGRNLSHLPHPIRYRFVVGTRSLAGSVVEISRSELVDLAAPDQPKGAFGGTYVQSNTHQAGFDVRSLQSLSENTAALESVVWSITEEDFMDIALARLHEAQVTQTRMAVPGPMTQAALEVE